MSLQRKQKPTKHAKTLKNLDCCSYPEPGLWMKPKA